MPQNQLSLIEQINEKRAQVQINALTYDMDWITHQIKAGEILIDPEYQRLFQWSEEQESRFIESLILNLPIPPIYLVEEEDGRRILLDGLQRICTYLHFTNEMPKGFEALVEQLNKIRTKYDDGEFIEEIDDEDQDLVEVEGERVEEPLSLPPLKLTGCDIIIDLNGKTYQDLDIAIQRRLKHKPIDIYSYSSSDTWIQYQMFTRMNAGGSPLSFQQVRNAKIRIISKDFIDIINKIAKADWFLSLATRFFGKAVIENRKMELQEIILKLFAFANHDKYYEKNIGEFLDKYLEGVSAKQIPFDSNEQVARFQKTCELLNKNLQGKRILRVKGKAYASMFEAIFINVFNHIDRVQPKVIQGLQNSIDSLKENKNNEDDEVFPFKGGGKNTKSYHDRRQEIVKKLLNLQ